MKRKPYLKRSILLWLNTKNLFKLLLAITCFILLVSIYFVNIFGAPNGTTTTTAATAVTHTSARFASLSSSSSMSGDQYDGNNIFLINHYNGRSKHRNPNHHDHNNHHHHYQQYSDESSVEISPDEYGNIAQTATTATEKSPKSASSSGRWWKWLWFKDILKTFLFRSNDASGNGIQSDKHSILAKRMDETLAANDQKRLRLIQKNLDLIFDQIRLDKQHQSSKCEADFVTVNYVRNFTAIQKIHQQSSSSMSCDLFVIESSNQRSIIENYYQTILKDDNQIEGKVSINHGQSIISPNRLYYNHFEELESLLSKPEILCNLFETVRTYPAIMNGHPIAPLCFQLPQMFQKFIDVSDSLSRSVTDWTLEYGADRANSARRVKEPVQVFSPADRNHLIQINRLLLKQQLSSAHQSSKQNDSMMKTFLPPILIKQHLIQQVVRFGSTPIKLRIFTLITSMNPLRALQYKHGMIYSYQQPQPSNVSMEPLDTLDTFWSTLSNEQKFQAQNSIQTTLIYSLMLLEVNERLLFTNCRPPSCSSSSSSSSSTWYHKEYGSDWPPINQFQWLAFDLVLLQQQQPSADTFQALIVDISPVEQIKQDLRINNNHLGGKQLMFIKQLEADTERFLRTKFIQNTGSLDKVLDIVQRKLRPMLLEKDEFGLLDINCHISHKVCLNRMDIDYIVDSVQEFEQIKTQNGFRLFQSIYPFEWNQIEQLQQIRALFEQILLHLDSDGDEQHHRSHQPGQSSTFQTNLEYKTERLHPVMEVIFARPSTISMVESNPTMVINGEQVEVDHHDLTNLNWTGHKTGLTGLMPASVDDDVLRSPSSILDQCSNDPITMVHLNSVKIVQPKNIGLRPEFHPYQMHYQLNDSIDYNQMLIQIQVKVEHCDSWLRLDNHFDNVQFGVLNFSLGLGDNHIRLPLTDGRYSHQQLSVYTIVVHRRSRIEQYPYEAILNDHHRKWPEQSLEICSLTQDCDLHVYPTMDCGWRSTNKTVTIGQIIEKTWPLLFRINDLVCENGAKDGRWLVPCKRCGHERTCLWNDLYWLPFDCHYQIPVDSNQLSQCLSNKNILMIGDSTNRGIMHYILERLNRTLTEADKTHDYKTYNLLDFDTRISFAYYPKFWLTPNQRPSFAQVFGDSLKTFLGANTTKNNMDTIIIIGGVQWISRQHLHIARKELKKIQDSSSGSSPPNHRIRLVVKTLGSGFHQSVIGVHYMPVNDQIKLAMQNQQLIQEALSLNIEPIDTFNKTISMFKDFYPGKCACHFHKIIKEKDSGLDSGSPHPTSSKESIHYHVDGPLNRLYSEILLSRICK